MRKLTRVSIHDKKVLRIAAAYLGKGYDVRADLPNYEKPRPIRGRIPDVVATRGKTTKIVEVETQDSFRSHKDQRDILRDFARQRPRTTFRWTKTD